MRTLKNLFFVICLLTVISSSAFATNIDCSCFVEGPGNYYDWGSNYVPAGSTVSWSLSLTTFNVQPGYNYYAKASVTFPVDVSISDRNTDVAQQHNRSLSGSKFYSYYSGIEVECWVNGSNGAGFAAASGYCSW